MIFVTFPRPYGEYESANARWTSPIKIELTVLWGDLCSFGHISRASPSLRRHQSAAPPEKDSCITMTSRLRRSSRRPTASSLRVENLEPRALLAGDVVINEIAAAGASFVDEDGDTPDWIELQNIGDEAVDISGWFLTDDFTDLTKWQFPDADSLTLDPGGLMFVYASNKDRRDATVALHTNFRLSSAGEFVALVDADGSTIVDALRPFPPQASGVTYGRASAETVTPLIDGEAAARFVAPTAEIDPTDWTSAEFEDFAWTEGTASLGYAVDPFESPLDDYGTAAYHSPLGMSGNQAFRGSVGLDFVVERPIEVTSLGIFDDGSNGFFSRLRVRLWSRDDGGTPDDRRDDQGLEELASATLRGSRSPLIGGTRYALLNAPVQLQPGAYSIVATGFSTLDRNAVGFAGAGVTELADTDAIRFVGSRLGLPTADFPNVVGLGPPNHYGAGSFTFKTAELPEDKPPADGEIVAYQSPAVLGNAVTGGNLGLDFQVIRPIRVTEVGVFDSGQDGIAGTVGVSVWSRTTGEQLAGKTIIGDEGSIAPDTGMRFVPLDEPLLLPPGDYTVLATGFFGGDPFLHSQRAGGQLSDLDDGDGAIQFEGTGRYNVVGPSFIGDIFGPNRFFEEPHHRLPPVQDVGPVNRWSAGTIKYQVAILEHAHTNVTEQLAEPSQGAFVRMPFNPGDVAQLDGLRLSANYDDGFVAYLNGTEVLRVNAPDMTTWESKASGSRTDLQAIIAETYDLSEFTSRLVSNAENVLAVHLLSFGDDDPDLVFDPRLEGFTQGESFTGFFVEPTPIEANGEALLGLAVTPEPTTGGIVDPSRLDGDGNLMVSITHTTADADVYYTTDGSPPSSDNGLRYEGPFAVDRSTVLRAIELKDDYLPSPVATATYLFLDDVVATDGVPEGFPTHWNAEAADYAISQNPDDLAAIAGDLSLGIDEAREVIKDSLKSLPTMSIVADMESIFGLPDGFYTNPYPRGRLHEHPASVEYYEADGSFGFQINAGLRMMGWTSRIPGVSPKHSLRLLFRDEYGAGRLEYPLFPGSDVNSFDTLALRSNSRDSWISDYPFGEGGGVWEQFDRGAMRSVASYIRDQWSREVQADMGMQTAEGTFVHLYINGIYWGVYNPTERPDGAWSADHQGGDEDDYDSVVFCNASPTQLTPSPRAAHGDLEVWNQMIAILDDGVAGDAAYQRIFGNNPDGTRNPDLPVLLDLDNFIDFMISGQYDAADDWPCNFYANRRRGQNDDGFQFTTWDNDLALPMGQLSANTVPADLFGALEASPWRIHAALAQNADYVIRFADRVQMHLFGDGALTPAATAERWQRIVDQIAPGMIAESARWGDYRRDVEPVGPTELYTKSNHWDVFVNDMVDNYFPNRTDVVLSQLRAAGLFPDTVAPTLSQNGGAISPGAEISLDAPAGTIYYTLDGTDPRADTTNITLLNDETLKHVLIPNGPQLGTDWTIPDFNDVNWPTGRSGVGFDFQGGNSHWTFIGLDVRPMIQQFGDGSFGIAFPSVYMRIPFQMTADDLVDLDFLKLKMRADDGFVAYLNGDVVARSNSPRRPAWNTFATGDVADGIAKTFRNFDLSAFVDKLVPGENVLAIHGMSSAIDDFDLLFSAELVAGTADAGVASPTAIEYTGPITLDHSLQVNARVFDGTEWSPLTQASFATGTPLRVSEIYYNPPGAAETTEFIELVNIGSEPVDLLGVHFADGIGYEFLAGDSILSLDPGQYIAIAKDPSALRAAFPDLPADVLIADRGFIGQLNNGGERIILADRGGTPIHEFTYDDAWYPTTDGDGFSLAIVDALADLPAWNAAAGWQASSQLGGTPGTGERIIPRGAAGEIAPVAEAADLDDVNIDNVLEIDRFAGHTGAIREPESERGYEIAGAVPLAREFIGAFPEFVASPAHAVQVPLEPRTGPIKAHALDIPKFHERTHAPSSESIRDGLFANWAADDAWDFR